MTHRANTIEERIFHLESTPRAINDEATTLVEGRRLDSHEAVAARLATDAPVRQDEVTGTFL
jgi:hypothetical protein